MQSSTHRQAWNTPFDLKHLRDSMLYSVFLAYLQRVWRQHTDTYFVVAICAGNEPSIWGDSKTGDDAAEMPQEKVCVGAGDMHLLCLLGLMLLVRIMPPVMGWTGAGTPASPGHRSPVWLRSSCHQHIAKLVCKEYVTAVGSKGSCTDLLWRDPGICIGFSLEAVSRTQAGPTPVKLVQSIGMQYYMPGCMVHVCCSKCAMLQCRSLAD